MTDDEIVDIWISEGKSQGGTSCEVHEDLPSWQLPLGQCSIAPTEFGIGLFKEREPILCLILTSFVIQS